ncbi:glutamate 5-kinase [Isosphaera pallida ATCC 43644]|uniref:Glutamate 5-kinase n=1 Tax=Isosphaera pallida (strain ATCC 43644 / DSM 9630 / IS1B) TaxID=575540 RepID=E8R3Q8_ISOPI|nr:glutamate 5-kinase [Isosphaera pallida]ADV62643.1 glutamate 5-kinase [Isosphaera pallida ATCC 43644]
MIAPFASNAVSSNEALARQAGGPRPGSPLVRDLVRDEVVMSADVWVVKVGSSVLTGPDGRIDPQRLHLIAREIGQVCDTGRRVALVSSGAVAAGIGQLGLPGRPEALRQLQAAAAVGQAHLLHIYDEVFRRQGRHAAQLLLNHDDFDNRERYLNIRNTMHALFEWRAVPVINENDSVSVNEIKLGDNDTLAAMVANLIPAPLLVILSVVDGLYPTDPTCETASDPTRPNEPIRLVPRLDEATLKLAGLSKSALGTGGMTTKLRAAGLVTRAGGSVIIASGRHERPLTRFLNGEPGGTLFLAEGRSQDARRRWIGLTARPKGRLIVDDGAKVALVEKGRSLLPIGLLDARGDFDKGDVVAVEDRQGREFARGLVNYGLVETLRVRGLRADQLKKILGAALHDEIIHRDNLVIL